MSISHSVRRLPLNCWKIVLEYFKHSLRNFIYSINLREAATSTKKCIQSRRQPFTPANGKTPTSSSGYWYWAAPLSWRGWVLGGREHFWVPPQPLGHRARVPESGPLPHPVSAHLAPLVRDPAPSVCPAEEWRTCQGHPLWAPGRDGRLGAAA